MVLYEDWHHELAHRLSTIPPHHSSTLALRLHGLQLLHILRKVHCEYTQPLITGFWAQLLQAMSSKNQAYCSATCRTADHGISVTNWSDGSSSKSSSEADCGQSKDSIRAWSMDVYRVSSPIPSHSQTGTRHYPVRQPTLLRKLLHRQPVIRLNFDIPQQPQVPLTTVASRSTVARARAQSSSHPGSSVDMKPAQERIMPDVHRKSMLIPQRCSNAYDHLSRPALTIRTLVSP